MDANEKLPSSLGQLMNDIIAGTATDVTPSSLEGTTSSLDATSLSSPLSKGKPSSIIMESPSPSIHNTTTSVISVNPGQNNILDLTNQESFPSLPKSNIINQPKWIPPKPSISTPSSVSGKPVAKKTLPQEKFEVAASLVATGRRATPAEIAKVIAAKYHGVSIETSSKKGVLSFLVTGKADALPIIRREILSAVCTQVTQTLMVPAGVRPFIIGKGGSNLHALVTRTMTKITIPRQNAGDAGIGEQPQQQDEGDQPVIIVGDPEGVELAKREIDVIVSEKTRKHIGRINIDRVFQLFVAGPGNANFEKLQNEFTVRIHMAPILANEKSSEPKKEKDGKTNNPDEIVIVGERDAVKQVEEKLKKIYENAKPRIKTIQLQVSKKQHRFVIGPRGSNLQEIFRETGCVVEVPPTSDSSDMILVRGVEESIGMAVQAVFARANSTVIEEINVRELLPKSTGPHHLVRHIAMKHKDAIKDLETTHSVSVLNVTSPANLTMFEIHAKSRDAADTVRNALKKLIVDLDRELVFVKTTIPRELHKFVVGKGGANIQKLRKNPQYGGMLIDVNVSSEEKESDDVVIVVKRSPTAKNGKADEDAYVMANKVKEDLLSQATTLADLVTQVMDVDNKYHGRIIGAGGFALRSLLEAYADRVSIKLPDSKSDDSSINKNVIVVRGPKADVAKVVETLQSMLKEWKRTEALSSFKEVITVPSGSAVKTIGVNGSSIGWLNKAIREKLANASEKDRKSVEEAGASVTGHLGLRVEVSESTKGDIITIWGPKVVIALAKPLISNTVNATVNIFDEVDSEAKETIASQSDILEFKNTIMRHVVGQGQRNLKKIEDRHGVSIKVVRRRQSRAAELADPNETNSSIEDTNSDTGLLGAANNLDDKFADGIFEIKGLKNDVEAARKELVASANYEVLHAYSITFQIPQASLSRIVGKGGAKIAALRSAHHVQIDLADDSSSPSSSLVTIEGARMNVEAAQGKILETVNDTVHILQTILYPLPSHLHRHVIGPGGQRIKQIVDLAGGTDKAKVQFPKVGVLEGANEVTLKGSQSTLQILKAEIEKVVYEVVGHSIDTSFATEEVNAGDNNFTPSSPISEESIEHVFSIPPSEASRVVGKHGETARSIMKKYNVIVFVKDADMSNEDDQLAQVRILGKRDSDIEAAKSEIISKLRTKVTMSLPAPILEIFRAGGIARDVNMAALEELARKLKGDLNVVLELPFGFMKEGGNGDGDEEITARGGENLPVALKEVEKFLNDLGKNAAYIPIEHSLRGHIIGREGRNLKRMRMESGASMDIMKVQGRDIVVVRGSAKEVEAASSLIDDVFKDQERRAVSSSSSRPIESITQVSARIDDDDINSSAGTSLGGPSIPGWSGRRNQQQNKKRQQHLDAISGSNVTSELPPSGVAVSATTPNASRKESDTWQDVRSRKSKRETAQATTSTPSPPPPPPPTAVVADPQSEHSYITPTEASISPPQPTSSYDSNKGKYKRVKLKTVQQQQYSSSIPGAPPPTGPSRPLDFDEINPSLSSTSPRPKPPATPEIQPIQREEEEWKTVNSVRKFKDKKKADANIPTSVLQPASGSNNSRPATPVTDYNNDSADNETATGEKKKKKKKKTGAPTQVQE